MATGKRLGTVFVELGLDSTAYTASEKKVLAGAKEATGSIEANWKQLGGKCDAYYDAMAKSFMNSHQRIINSGFQTTETIARSYALMNAKLAALDKERYASKYAALEAEKAATLSAQKAMQANWANLGIRSTAAIEAQKAAVMASFNTISQNVQKGSQDWINIEKAKNSKIKELNAELVGDHDISWRSMTNTILRFTGIVFVAGIAISGIKNILMGGVKEIDSLKTSTIAVAAQITTMQGTTGNVVENYRQNVIYAEALNKKLMEIDANSFANLSQIQLMNRAMVNQGVLLDVNNAKQIESFTALTNAVALFTTGQDKEKQASQEIRSLMSGQIRAGDMVAMQMDALIKKQGDYKDGLKGLIEEGKKHGDTLERMQPYLIGIVAASGDISKTWEAISSSAETAWGIMQRDIFKDFYKGLVDGGAEAVKWAKENSAEVGVYIRAGLNSIADIIQGIWGVLKGFAPLARDFGSAVSIVAYGWGGVFAVLKPIGEFLGNSIALTYDLVKMLGNAALAVGALATGQIDVAKTAWSEAKKNYSDVEKLSVANRKILVDGIADAVVAYDAQYKAAKKASSVKIETPKVTPGGGAIANSEREAALKQITEATRKATYEIDSVGLSQYQKDLDRIKAEADKYRKAGVDKVTVAKFVAAETELALRKSFVVQTEENKKMYEEMQKGAEEYRKMVSEEQSFSVSKHEKAMLEIIANEDNKLRAAEKLMDEGKISWDEYQAYLLLVQQNSAIATQELIQKELSEYADFYSQITGYEEEYRDNKLKWIDKEQKRLAELYKDDVAAAKWAADQKGKLEYDLFKKKTDYIADGFGNLSSAFDGISKLYAEGSKDAEKWEEAAKTMEIAQRAVAVVQAVAAIATQGLGDPYTAFARVAAMAATMGALLASIGESVSGSSASVAAASQRTSSTALGSEEASTSISNSLEILQDTYDIENTRLTQIYNEMRDLNNNITGLVTSIVRAGETSSFSSSISTGSIISSDYFGYGSGGYNTGINILDSALNSVQESLFGSTSVSLIKEGYRLGKTSISDILSGIDVSVKNWAQTLTEEDGGWFGSDSSYTTDYYSAADSSVTRLFNIVYQNLSESLLSIAQNLGTSIQDVLEYTFSGKKLDLKDMTTDEMNTAINEYFSTISDNAVEALFGDLISQYQQLNEGLMETAVRLISDKETIASILELTNQTFNGTTSQFIKFSEALIDVAGSLDDLTDAFSTYYDAFFTDAEKQADYKKQLSGVMSSYGYSLPTSRTGYRDIVESLDLTTDAGMSAYYALLAVSETADKYYDYLENAASSVSESQYATKVEYLRAVRGYADGGVASGLAWVGENGKELAYFDQPTKIYSNSESGKIVSQGELIAEVRALREDLQAQNGSIATYNYKMTKYLQFLEQWDAGGIPTERAA